MFELIKVIDVKNNIIKKLIFVIIILSLFCCSKKKISDFNSQSGVSRSENTVLIASFNALRLGEKQKDYSAFAKILSNFDLIGLEEVMNEKGVKKVRAHLEKLTQENWDYIISDHSVGSENYREFYAFIYRKNKFLEAKPVGFYAEKDENEFMREPFGAYFKSGNFDFVYIIAHSVFGDKEKQRLIEASNYVNVYEYFSKLTDEDDIIIAGDFNMSADSLAFKNLRIL